MIMALLQSCHCTASLNQVRDGVDQEQCCPFGREKQINCENPLTVWTLEDAILEAIDALCTVRASWYGEKSSLEIIKLGRLSICAVIPFR